MPSASDRLEFAPPPQPGMLRAVILAVLAHLLLLIALTFGLRWNRESQDLAAEAELWSSVPQQAAPRELPPPPPPTPTPAVRQQPVARAEPKPPPPAPREADIALEREKKRKAEIKQREEEQARLERERRKKLEAQLAQRKLEQQKEKEKEQKKLEAQHRIEVQKQLEAQHRIEVQKQLEAQHRLEEQKKLQATQLAAENRRKEEEKKRRQREKEEQETRRVAQLREENLRRIQGMAGATGGGTERGSGAQSSGPSATWGSRVQARVRPKIVFPDDAPGNPTAEVDIKLAPDGTIVSRKISKSSGVHAWDEAVLRALDKTEVLPRDIDGRVPSGGTLVFKRRD